MTMSIKLKIGLVGFGCVGQGLYEVLNKSQLVHAEIVKIVVKTKDKPRSIAAHYFSYDVQDILSDDSINTVVELIDDAAAAYVIVKAALDSGKHVISANKKLIAEHLEELIDLAKEKKVSFLYEASVCGSIPIIRNLEEYYNNDSLKALFGICNGTTNYILSQTNQGKTYDEALAEAQELGFAESDPTLDVDGFDAKYKLQVLIKHAFGVVTQPDEVFNYGIRQLKEADIKFASEKGYRLKLIARAEKFGDKVIGFVAPHFVKSSNELYGVNDEFNAVIVEALFSDRQLFVGKGAGSYPTASAVLSDISALSYGYKYEYKGGQGEHIIFSSSFLLPVYAGATRFDLLEKLPFVEKEEVYQSDDYNYITGWVDFDEIKKIDFNEEKEMFFGVLPKSILLNERSFASQLAEELH